MSKKTKLEKFAEILHLPNVFENFSFHHPSLSQSSSTVSEMKGRWNELYFENDFPITLELACGGGEYCLGLSLLFPQNNFIGIDIKGARIWKGAKKAHRENNKRIAFVRTSIELIPHFFSNAEINEIWITFPDPFLKKSKSNKRLTSPYFLSIYKQILKRNAMLHLKTDDVNLYNFTLETLHADPDFNILLQIPDLYNSGTVQPELQLRTYYELMHLDMGKTIKYIKFKYQ